MSLAELEVRYAESLLTHSTELRGKDPLRDPVFVTFVAGEAISKTGNAMNQVAMGWLALVMTGSPFAVGVVAAAGTLPILVLSTTGGVLADRYDRARILITTSTVAGVAYAILAAATATGTPNLALMAGVAAVAGAAQALDTPALYALVGQLAGPGHVLRALAANAAIFNIARLVGPGIGGVLVASGGAGLVFALNAASYLPLIIGLSLVGRRAHGRVPRAPGQLPGWNQARAFLRGDRVVTLLIVMMGLDAMLGIGFLAFAPAVAAELDAGPEGVGVLLGSVGVGAITGGILLGRRAGRVAAIRIVPVAGVMIAIGGAAVAVSPVLVVTAGAMALAGGSAVVFSASVNAVIQTRTPDMVRGRVLSLYTLAGSGLLPVGSLLTGAVAEIATIRVALLLGSLSWLVVLVVGARRLRKAERIMESR
jgi:MFS family permease